MTNQTNTNKSGNKKPTGGNQYRPDDAAKRNEDQNKKKSDTSTSGNAGRR